MKTILALATVIISLAATPAFADDSGKTESTNPAGSNDPYNILRQQLPPAPDGFSWDFFENATFLQPKNWFVHTKKINPAGPGLDTYATSPTDFSEQHQFETGFTISRFFNLEKFQKPKPSDSAVIMVRALMGSHAKEDIKYFSHSKRGDYDLTWFRYRDAPPGLTPIIIHQFYIANDSTDNLDIFMFESPEDQWDKNWTAFGSVMLSKNSVIPNYPNE